MSQFECSIPNNTQHVVVKCEHKNAFDKRNTASISLQEPRGALITVITYNSLIVVERSNWYTRYLYKNSTLPPDYKRKIIF